MRISGPVTSTVPMPSLVRQPTVVQPKSVETTVKTVTGPSEKMQKYIEKSSSSSKEVAGLTQKTMIADLKQRCQDLGAVKIKENSEKGGIVNWLKNSALGRLFSKSTPAEPKPAVQEDLLSGKWTRFKEWRKGDGQKALDMKGLSQSFSDLKPTDVDTPEKVNALLKKVYISAPELLSTPAKTTEVKALLTALATNPATEGIDALKESMSAALLNKANDIEAKIISGNSGKTQKREATIEKAKAGAGLVSSGHSASHSAAMAFADTSSKVITTTAQISSVAGSVGATVSLIMDSKDAWSAHTSKAMIKAFRNPTRESLDKMAGSLEKKSAELEATAAKLMKPRYLGLCKADPAKAAQLLERASALKAKAQELKGLKPEDAKIKNTELDAMAKQVQKRAGVGFRILTALKSAVSLAASIALTVAVFAGAAALAATPVGWALAGVAAVAGIGLCAYKLAKTVSRNNVIHELKGQHKQVNIQIEKTQEELGKLGSDHPDKPKLEAKLQDLKELDKDLTVMRKRKDPQFAISNIMNDLRSSDPQKAQETANFLQVGLGIEPAKFKAMPVDDAVKLLKTKLKVF